MKMKLIIWNTVYRSKIMLMLLASTMTMQGQGYDGEILTGPQTQVVVPGEIAHFICHALGESVYWYINNTNPHPQSIYEARGFSFSYTVLSNPRNGPEEHNNTISVEAHLSNNSTRIACNAIGTYTNQHAFQEGTLIIAGPPSSLVVNFTQGHLVDGFVHSHLSWSTPFTLPHFPITNYTITMFNHSNGETITTTRTSNYADYLHQSLSQGDHCYELDFTVVAANRLGSSPPATIHSGHPIVPGEIDEIETVITFLNATPHLWISFLAPRICPYSYQTGFYNITIYDIMNQTVVHLGPTEYTQMNESEQILIVNEFIMESTREEYYTVEVAVESIGVVEVKRKNIDTFVNGPPNMTTVNESENQSTTSEPPTSYSKQLVSSTNDFLDIDSADNRQYTSSDSIIATAAALGVIACLSCFMTIILLVILIIQRRKRKSDGGPVAYSKPRKFKKSKKPKPAALPSIMESNPIYGPVYETTPGEGIKSLISPTSSVPSTPADITPRYFHIDMPPSLPPPRNGSVAALPKLETVDEIDAIKASIKDAKIPQSGEESQYMVMNGARPDGKTDLLPSNGHAHDADKSIADDVYTMMK